MKDENSTHDLCIIGIILLMSSLHPSSIFFRYLHTSSIIASSLLTLQRVAIIVRMSRTNDKGLVFTSSPVYLDEIVQDSLQAGSIVCRLLFHVTFHLFAYVGVRHDVLVSHL